MTTAADSALVTQLKEFFSRPVCNAATKPLREGVQIAIYLDDQGPVCLTKKNKAMTVETTAPAKPDMTFWVPAPAVATLTSLTTEDVGEIGVEILKLMAHDDAAHRISAKVHIGTFDLLRHGYLGVLPLGGPAVMKFLASKGLTGVGKIKDAISKLKS